MKKSRVWEKEENKEYKKGIKKKMYTKKKSRWRGWIEKKKEKKDDKEKEEVK